MNILPGPALDFSLRAPSQERLDQLAEKIYGVEDFESLAPDRRATVYQLAIDELSASGLMVLAQFLAKLA